jgi:hypothetical protein
MSEELSIHNSGEIIPPRGNQPILYANPHKRRRANQGIKSVWQARAEIDKKLSRHEPFLQAAILPRKIPANAARTVELVNKRTVHGSLEKIISETGAP